MDSIGNSIYRNGITVRAADREELLRPLYALRRGLPRAGIDRRGMDSGIAAGGAIGCTGMRSMEEGTLFSVSQGA